MLQGVNRTSRLLHVDSLGAWANPRGRSHLGWFCPLGPGGSWHGGDGTRDAAPHSTMPRTPLREQSSPSIGVKEEKPWVSLSIVIPMRRYQGSTSLIPRHPCSGMRSQPNILPMPPVLGWIAFFPTRKPSSALSCGERTEFQWFQP